MGFGIKIALCSLVVVVCLVGGGEGGGGGKGSKHEILKIHVPEIVKHEHHTHYVFIHKHHHPKKVEKPKKHGHHFHKWSVHKSSGHSHKGGHSSGHKSGGHGHKSGGHGHKSGGHGHGHGHGHMMPMKHHKMMMKHHPKKHHDPFFTEEQHPPTGYEVMEEGYVEEDPYSIPYSGVTSYDIPPYHQQNEVVYEGETFEPLPPQMMESDDGYGFGHGQMMADGQQQHHGSTFGEIVPAYEKHHKHYLKEVNHGIHSSVFNDQITKFNVEDDESGDSGRFHHSFDDFDKSKK